MTSSSNADITIKKMFLLLSKLYILEYYYVVTMSPRLSFMKTCDVYTKKTRPLLNQHKTTNYSTTYQQQHYHHYYYHHYHDNNNNSRIMKCNNNTKQQQQVVVVLLLRQENCRNYHKTRFLNETSSFYSSVPIKKQIRKLYKLTHPDLFTNEIEKKTNNQSLSTFQNFVDEYKGFLSSDYHSNISNITYNRYELNFYRKKNCIIDTTTTTTTSNNTSDNDVVDR